MRVLMVADATSPFTQQWVIGLRRRGCEVLLVSSRPLAEAGGEIADFSVPLALSNQSSRSSRKVKARAQSSARMLKFATEVRRTIAPLEALRSARLIERQIRTYEPHLVHAMRIPMEGIATAAAMQRTDIPLVTSIWGNDLTLHAAHNPVVARYTRRTLRRTSALHVDCQRDANLAKSWGYARASVLHVPGSVGVDTSIFYRAANPLTPDVPHHFISARGVREYVRNDTLLAAAALLKAKGYSFRLTCVGTDGSTEMRREITRLGMQDLIRLTPVMSRTSLSDLFRAADTAMSITEHDGTPNTLLEAMASGLLPIAGDLASIREIISHGVNGLLCPPASSEAVAVAMATAIEDSSLRGRAIALNQKFIEGFANVDVNLDRILDFYEVTTGGPRAA